MHYFNKKGEIIITKQACHMTTVLPFFDIIYSVHSVKGRYILKTLSPILC